MSRMSCNTWQHELGNTSMEGLLDFSTSVPELILVDATEWPDGLRRGSEPVGSSGSSNLSRILAAASQGGEVARLCALAVSILRTQPTIHQPNSSPPSTSNIEINANRLHRMFLPLSHKWICVHPDVCMCNVCNAHTPTQLAYQMHALLKSGFPLRKANAADVKKQVKKSWF